MKNRLLLLAVLAVVVAAAVYGLSRPATVTPPVPDPVPSGPAAQDGVANADDTSPVPFQQASDCRPCHEEVYGEWTRSYHGMAWTDPMVQALANGFRMTECIDCHAPIPIHVTGVDQRVAPRQHGRSDGVDCLSCHLMPDGFSVAAAHTIDTSATEGACKPVLVESMTDASACIGCHNQHETVDELEISGIDKTCLDCHMEPVDRGGGRSGRGHTFPGAHSLVMHRRAIELTARVEGGNVVARVANVGAGHKVPTDARHRSYNVWASFTDTRGNVVTARQEVFEIRLYYRQDFKDSTQIAHGEFREGSIPIPDGISGKARIWVTYALNPELLAKPEDLPLIYETEVEF